ncbi:protease pro-enzyme activation domain-containing protein [Lactobacillus sp. Sy-1]|uniref:S53 family peptidase n=1 Tax=Lactobacillus sp. Sy-1 TaxID=2109645 RepID=UPI001C5B6B37|nr:S53 family peptidase [Lactobacillus sp. Sy-1]MBW1606389.1 S8/S53 family peptidase [Lactobacillus sp. Sy-1]
MKFSHSSLLLVITASIMGSTVLSGVTTSVNASQTKYRRVNENQQQTITLGLKSRNDKRLDQFIYQTVNPKSKNYRRYLTPTQFGNQYGLSNQRVAVVKKFIKKQGLKSNVYPGNIVMTVSGKTKNIEKTFQIKIFKTTNKKHNYQIARGKARLASSVANDVSFIDQLGLKVHLTNDKTNPSQQEISALNKIKDPNINDRSYRKFGRSYHTGSLSQNGHNGQGQTIGILGSNDFKMSDINAYLKDQGVKSGNRRIKKVYVSKPLSKDYGDQAEVTMDTEQASAIAPAANINVYLGDDYDADYFIPSYATAIGRDNVDVISSSFGASEVNLKQGRPVDKGETNLLNRLLKQAAAQGITVFNASGDTGAYDFSDGTKEKSVGLPAASPYITAVGGTTLPFKNVSFADVSGFTPSTGDKTVSLNKEAPWSNSTSLTELFGSKFVKDEEIKYLLSKAKTDAQKAAIEKQIQTANKNANKTVSATTLGNIFASGGGGFSRYFTIPDYQKGISGVGTFNAKQFIDLRTGKVNANPKLITGRASGRNVPDISGNADFLTGYNIYVDGKYDPSGDGTSVITPQMAAMAAVINSAQKKRTGFWNPQIYRFAKTAHSPFTPLNSLDDNNLYYVGQPGKIYNQASGLGTVNFTKLNAAFTKDAKK